MPELSDRTLREFYLLSGVNREQPVDLEFSRLKMSKVQISISGLLGVKKVHPPSLGEAIFNFFKKLGIGQKFIFFVNKPKTTSS